jgi:hypothetical protein
MRWKIHRRPIGGAVETRAEGATLSCAMRQAAPNLWAGVFWRFDGESRPIVFSGA